MAQQLFAPLATRGRSETYEELFKARKNQGISEALARNRDAKAHWHDF